MSVVTVNNVNNDKRDIIIIHRVLSIGSFKCFIFIFILLLTEWEDMMSSVTSKLIYN